MYLHTLEFLINVLDQISVLVGKYGKNNKRTGPNKRTGGKNAVLVGKCPPPQKRGNNSKSNFVGNLFQCPYLLPLLIFGGSTVFSKSSMNGSNMLSFKIKDFPFTLGSKNLT